MKKFDLNFYSGKRVLVTGHTGFKGTWLCRLLLNMGAQVTGYSLQPPTEPSIFGLAGMDRHPKSGQTSGSVQREQAGNSAASGSPADCARIL